MAAETVPMTNERWGTWGMGLFYHGSKVAISVNAWLCIKGKNATVQTRHIDVGAMVAPNVGPRRATVRPGSLDDSSSVELDLTGPMGPKIHPHYRSTAPPKAS